MHSNNRGSILAVTVVAMIIMMTIGLICLQMFYAQNVISTYDQIKLRTFYSAEGAIELARATIDSVVEAHKVGAIDINNYLFMMTTSDWYMLETVNGCPLFSSNKCFDGTMYPDVNCRVYCKCLGSLDIACNYRNVNFYREKGIPFPFLGDKDYGYEIVAIASATYKTNLSQKVVVSTLTYYFCTVSSYTNVSGTLTPTTDHNKRYFVFWSKDVVF